MKKAAQAFVIFIILLAATVVVSAPWLARAQPPGAADAVLVLGAAMNADGTLHASSLRRVAAGVALYRQGVAPMVVMSGGRPGPGQPAAGALMARAAVDMGVPEAAVHSEEASHSTLQNAILTRPLLEALGVRRVVVVTDGFHMARSLATLRWAGIGVAGHRTAAIYGDTWGEAVRMVARETAALGFNIARVALWHLAVGLGVAPDRLLPLLA